MPLEFSPVEYQNLKSAQQENYNYHKVSARLADYGYTTIRLYDDFQGADFIAKHVGNESLIRVQLKGRLTFKKMYERPGVDERDQIYIAFRENDEWYLYPHDTLFQAIKESPLTQITFEGTTSWDSNGAYHKGSIGNLQPLLDPYRIPHPDEL